MAKHFKYDEARFKPKQREVALALVEREFADKKVRKTQQEIAEENGITVMTMWRWNNQDVNFISYKNHLAAQFMDSRLALVYTKLIEAVEGGNTKAMELFLKRVGDLDTKGELTVLKGNDDETQEERLAKLKERLEASDNDDKDV